MTPRMARLRAELLPLGETLKLGSHTVTEEEIIRFATEWDHQYFHVDPGAARESYFGGIIANGIHTLSIYQRLNVLGLFDRSDVIAGKEARQPQFLHPVRPREVLTGSVSIGSGEHDGRGRAVAFRKTVLFGHEKAPFPG